MSVILNVTFVGLSIAATAGFASGSASLVALLVNTQFSDYVEIRFVSQLINGISSVLQKLLKCFNGTTILTSYKYINNLYLLLHHYLVYLCNNSTNFPLCLINFCCTQLNYT